jgi:hypothetical protein
MAAPILYCHCAYARVVPPETKTAVLEGLLRSGAEFEAVPDLCEMAARGDRRLAELASDGPLRIAACYPRAVKWLFASAGVDIGDAKAVVCNMRTDAPERVLQQVLSQAGDVPRRLPGVDE